MGSIGHSSIRRVAVIGSGPSGLATAKFLLNESSFSDVQIFEQSDSIEGAWKHSIVNTDDCCDVPQTNPLQPLEKPKNNGRKKGGVSFTTPMYDHLETNIPHQLMKYAGKHFDAENSLYPPRHVVSQYLESYAAELVDLIQFHTQAQDLHYQQIDKRDAWSLKTCDLGTGETKTQIFDAVAVCSGHYNTPYIPKITGLQSWAGRYRGSISHSKFYRIPDVFENKKVVIVGNSASGMDIANQVSQKSKLPLIMSQRSSSWLTGSHSKSEEQRMLMRPEIAEFLEPDERSRAIRFTDGHVEEDVDHVLFCTGYLYAFPFLSSFLPELIKDGFRVYNVYQHIFFRGHPSLAFVALPIRVIPFPLSEVQAAVIAKVWSGQLALPSKQEMLEWERNTVIQNGDGKKFLTLDGGRDFTYHNQLYDWASTVGFTEGLEPHRWTAKELWLRGKFPDLKKAYSQRGQDRFCVKTPEELGFDFERREE